MNHAGHGGRDVAQQALRQFQVVHVVQEAEGAAAQDLHGGAPGGREGGGCRLCERGDCICKVRDPGRTRCSWQAGCQGGDAACWAAMHGAREGPGPGGHLGPRDIPATGLHGAWCMAPPAPWSGASTATHLLDHVNAILQQTGPI
jgi:hypothetical protein